MLAQAVQRPAADTADLLVGTGEVEPGADIAAAAGVEQRDGVGGAGQPAQHAAGLLPVGVTVAGTATAASRTPAA